MFGMDPILTKEKLEYMVEEFKMLAESDMKLLSLTAFTIPLKKEKAEGCATTDVFKVDNDTDIRDILTEYIGKAYFISVTYLKDARNMESYDLGCIGNTELEAFEEYGILVGFGMKIKNYATFGDTLNITLEYKWKEYQIEIDVNRPIRDIISDIDSLGDMISDEENGETDEPIPEILYSFKTGHFHRLEGTKPDEEE